MSECRTHSPLYVRQFRQLILGRATGQATSRRSTMAGSGSPCRNRLLAMLLDLIFSVLLFGVYICFGSFFICLLHFSLSLRLMAESFGVFRSLSGDEPPSVDGKILLINPLVQPDCPGDPHCGDPQSLWHIHYMAPYVLSLSP